MADWPPLPGLRIPGRSIVLRDLGIPRNDDLSYTERILLDEMKKVVSDNASIW
jgi:hypothetical protein